MSAEITYVFFHVGHDSTMPAMLVSSIRHIDPDASVEQLTDLTTVAVSGVDGVHRLDIGNHPIMLARAIAYASLPETGRMRVFIDTDMLLLRPIAAVDFADDADIYLCRRYFDRDRYVNVNFNNMAMEEYDGYTLDRAWPYLGCFLATKSASVLSRLASLMKTLPEKYQNWYGDQIALKSLASMHDINKMELSEKNYAHLVNSDPTDYQHKLADEIKLLHFKGSRKQHMSSFYSLIVSGELSRH